MTDTFLLNDFYIIKSTQRPRENTLLIIIQLNADHTIFKGHFEQMPIVPGVCQTQIIKELLQIETQQNLVLAKGDNIKFTGMIIPSEHPEIHIELSFKKEENSYVVDAKLLYENTTFTKFKGSFKQY